MDQFDLEFSMQGDRPTVSVVILTYNSEGDIIPCLKSLQSDRSPGKEILVIDNASNDRSAEIVSRTFPDVRLIRNATNAGVAAGWNQGFRETSGEIVVVMNPDVEVSPDWLENIIAAFCEHPEADVAGIKLLYPSGKIQHGGQFFHPNAQSFHRAVNEEDRGQVDMVEPIASVTGAVMAVRRSAWESMGGFDEDYYPAYYEESDFCFRVRSAGREVLYVGSASAIHHEAATLGATSASYVRLYFRMRALYVLKNYSLRRIITESIPYELRVIRHWPAMHQFYAIAAWPWATPYFFRRLFNKLLGRPGRPYGPRAHRQRKQWPFPTLNS